MSDAGTLRYAQSWMGVQFVRLPVSVVLDTDLADGPMRLYCVIASYIWDGREVAWPSQGTLAEQMDVTVETIRRHMRALERHGLLITEHRPGGTSLYQLIVPEPRKPSCAPPPTDVRGLPPTDLRGEVEVVEVDEGTSTTHSSPSPPARATGAKTKKRQRPTEAQASMEIDLVLSNENAVDATLICEVLDRLSLMPKRGAKTPIGQLSRLYEMQEMREKYGRDAWLYGMRKAAAKVGLRDLGYVAAIAAGYQLGDEMQRGPSAARHQAAIDEEAAADDALRAIDRQRAKLIDDRRRAYEEEQARASD